MDNRNKWILYEYEKAMIQNENLTYKEYEMKIRELLDRLKL